MKITKAQLQQIIKEETQALVSEKGLLGKAMGAIGKKAKSAASNMKDQAIAKQAISFLKDKPKLAKMVIDELSKSIEGGQA